MFLMIRNPGVADHEIFTLMGASTTRNAGLSDTIGMYGSGAKFSIALLMRNDFWPTFFFGNTKMEIFSKPIKGFNRICVKFKGKGKGNNRTQELGFAAEMGEKDWQKIPMAFREFVSNAIDGAIASGGSYKDVEIEVVSTMRAKEGHTAVFIPYGPEIEKCYNGLKDIFLHFSDDPELLKQTCLPKRYPDTDVVLVYKNGVLASSVKGKSVFDYNIGSELELDESRNASDWTVKYAIAKALRDAPAKSIAEILCEMTKRDDVWEGTLPAYDLKDTYGSSEEKERRRVEFKKAWGVVGGDKAVATAGSILLAGHVQRKGYKPVHIRSEGWIQVLENYGIPTELQILTSNELEGIEHFEPTQEMLDCTKKVWDVLESLHLTNGKLLPSVKGFRKIMDGECQMHGYYVLGGSTIYLHTSLGVGKMMFKVCVEEAAHYVTQSVDGSRDLQDYLFNIIAEICC